MVPSVGTMTTTTQAKRVPAPTKEEEIAILRDAANKLGAQSYCGPWLAQQLQNIESEIRSDFMPSADIRAAQREAQQILENAQARAGKAMFGRCTKKNSAEFEAICDRCTAAAS